MMPGEKIKSDWEPFRSLRGMVRLILLIEWDPIEIFGFSKAMDEYDSYVDGVYTLLLSGADKDRLVSHLDRIEREQMGRRGERITAGRAAARLLEVFYTNEFEKRIPKPKED